MAKEPTLWAIAYVDPKRIHTLERDFMKHSKYRIVTAFVPIVKVLNKQFKGKKTFTEVPLLFNYGFFKVPKYFIPNPHFLEAMKKDFECIAGWVTDRALSTKKKGVMEDLYNPKAIAIASMHEIKRLRKAEELSTFYSAEDVNTLYIGKCITLHTYPFDGIPVIITEINKKNHYVKVKLSDEASLRPVKISFDNIFFTAYKDDYLNEKMKEEYLDDLKSRNKGIENVIFGKNEKRESKSVGDTDL
jgi:transcription antitermination factor NusG